MPCPRCGEPRIYNDKHDALYCAACDVWLQKKCGDPACDYCQTRPDKPSAADHRDDWYDWEEAP